MEKEEIPNFIVLCWILYVCFMPSHTSRNCQWGPIKKETLRQRIQFQCSYCILLTSHLYVATFQQYPYMCYISLNWYNISDLVVPVIIPWIKGCCQRGSYWIKDPWYLSRSRHLIKTMTLSTVTEYLSQMTIDIFSLSTVITITWLITGFLTTVKWGVSQVEPALGTLPEHVSWVLTTLPTLSRF